MAILCRLSQILVPLVPPSYHYGVVRRNLHFIGVTAVFVLCFAFFEKSKTSKDKILLQRTALRLDSDVSFLAWELRPAALDDIGLPEAANAYLEDWSHNYKISSGFSARGLHGHRLDAEIETHLYRIMQEALNNIVKHAEATRVNVLLERKPDFVTLIVEDNGVGFDTNTVATKGASGHGLGLLGMKERALLLNGNVEIESKKGSGTTLFVSIPLNSE